MTFPIAAFTSDGDRVAACNNLALPTLGSVAGAWAGVRLAQCAGCTRWGSEHFGCIGATHTGNTQDLETALIAIQNAWLARCRTYSIYLALMDLYRGLLDTDYTISGAPVLGSIGPYTVNSVGDLAVACHYDGGEQVSPATFANSVQPYAVIYLDNSRIAGGRFWVVKAVNALDENNDFTVDLYTPIGGLAGTAAIPANPMTATIVFYSAAGKAPWPAMTDMVPTWGTLGGETHNTTAGGTNPLKLIQGFLRSGPQWECAGTAPAQAPNPQYPETYDFYRRYCPALDNLCNEIYTTPNGYHEIHDYAFNDVCHWGKVLTWVDGTSGKTLAGLMSGFEAHEIPAVTPDLSDPETWPVDGPGAGNQTATKTGLDEAASDTNDPHRRIRQGSVIGWSGWIDRYNLLQRGGTLGEAQRFARTWVYFPLIALGMAEQEREYGTVQHGAWSAALVPNSASPTHQTLIRLKRGLSYDTTQPAPTPSTVRSVVIKAVTVNGDGTATIALKHATTTLTSRDSGQNQEWSSDIACGGGNVAMPQGTRITNSASDHAFNGDGHEQRVEIGDLLSLENGNIGEHLWELGLAVSKVVAADEAHGVTDWWNPEAGEGWDSTQDEAWYSTNVANHEGLPTGFHDRMKYCDTITVINENGIIAEDGLIDPDTLVGLGLTVKRGAVRARPGYFSLAEGQPTSAEGDTAITGAVAFLAAGLIYSPGTYVTDCLALEVDIADQNYLASIDTMLNPWVNSLKSVLSGFNFTLTFNQDSDTRTHNLTVHFEQADYDPQVTGAWDGGYYEWTEGNAAYSYYLTTGATENFIGTVISGDTPFSDYATTYANVLSSFFSKELHAVWFGDTAVSSAYLNALGTDFSATTVTYRFFWHASASPVLGSPWTESVAGPVTGKGYIHYATKTEAMTEMSLSLCLLGVTYTDTDPLYDVLATTGASVDAAGDVEVAFVVTDLVKAMIANRDNYDAFAAFLAVGDYTEIPSEIGATGDKFMRALFEKTCSRTGTTYETIDSVNYVTGEWSASQISYGEITFGSGVVIGLPDNMEFPSGV